MTNRGLHYDVDAAMAVPESY